MNDYVEFTLLPPLIYELSRVAPGIQLHVRAINRVTGLELLRPPSTSPSAVFLRSRAGMNAGRSSAKTGCAWDATVTRCCRGMIRSVWMHI